MSTAEAWGDIGQKYTIHEETFEYFRVLTANSTRALTDMTPQEARDSLVSTCDVLAGDVEFQGKITEFIVPVPNVKGGVPISVYKPTTCPSTAPVLVYFHGGGFVLGSRALVDNVCKSISRLTPCIVASVEYRLAPEHKLPAALDDAVCVTRWVKMNRALIGASNVSVLGVGGESAGGHLAATVCHEVPGLDFQVLSHPTVDVNCTHSSGEEFSKTPGLNKSLIDWFTDHALDSDQQKNNSRITPLLRQGFSALPPALLVLAELDPFRDCGYAYRDQMADAGVETQLELLQGVPHGFFRAQGVFKQNCAKAFSAVTNFIQKCSKEDGRLLLNDD